MSWSPIANTVKQPGVNGGTTDAINTTGANLIIVTVHSAAAGAPNVANLSDSAGNTWSTTTGRGTGGYRVRAFYCVSPTTSANHTFTYSEASSNAAITVQAWSGSHGTPLDQQSAGGSTTSATSLSAGAATASENGELYVTGITWITTITNVSVDNSFTISNSALTAGGGTVGCAMAYKVQATAASLTPTWSWTTASNCCAYSITFKASAAGLTVALVAAINGSEG